MNYTKRSIYESLREDACDQDNAEYYDAYSRCADEILKHDGEGVNYVGALVSYIHRYESECGIDTPDYEVVNESLDMLTDVLYSSVELHRLFEQFVVARRLLDEKEPKKTMSPNSVAKIMLLCHYASMLL